MIGILLALAVQSPFVKPPKCKSPEESTFSTLIDNMTTTHMTPNITQNLTSAEIFFSDHKYVIFAVIITVVFIIGNILLIAFVKEIDGNLRGFSKSIQLSFYLNYIWIEMF